MILYKAYKLDISMISYILCFEMLLFFLTSFFNNKIIYYSLNVFTAFFLFVLCVLMMIDVELYTEWGFRLDYSPFRYMQTPGAMVASVELSVFLKLFFIGMIIYGVFIWFYFKKIATVLKQIQAIKWKGFVFLFLSGVMIIPIRGGLGNTPINVSAVYFHSNPFVNHAAINIPWNIGDSYVFSKRLIDYKPLSEEQSTAAFNELFKTKGETINVLNNKKPNILIIVIESFASEIVKQYFHKDSSVANFDKLKKEGIFFSNFYTTGDRTNCALIATINGYPALTVTSIIYYPNKASKLPFLSKDLKNAGYKSSFFYGGDINFSNFNIHLINGQFDNIFSKKNLPHDTLCEWGVPDHILFREILKKTKQEEKPFFKIAFTLNNHRPYDIPVEKKYKGNTTTDKHLSATDYTDKAIGNFIEQAKKTDWWKNTLVVLYADHGFSVDNIPQNRTPDVFKIPMIWTGGAVRLKDTIISVVSYQADVPKTILAQLGINNDAYIYGKDIFKNNINPTAFYFYNNAIGYINDSCRIVYDNDSKSIIFKEGKSKEIDVIKAQAMLQKMFDDFNSK